MEEYEAEIQEREKRKSLVIPLEETVRLNSTNFTNSNTNHKNNFFFQLPIDVQPKNLKKGEAKKKTNQSEKNSNGKKTQAQITSNSNKKQTSSKNNETPSNRNNNNKRNNDKQKVQLKKPTDDSKPKSLAEDLKTDAGAASDESWEKDFDLSDQ